MGIKITASTPLSVPEALLVSPPTPPSDSTVTVVCIELAAVPAVFVASDETVTK